MTWCEPNCYPSEPIFVPAPNCKVCNCFRKFTLALTILNITKSEDDGVILASMVWGKSDENRVGLLVLCAKRWIEIGRCEFTTKGPVPKCLHGWFAADAK